MGRGIWSREEEEVVGRDWERRETLTSNGKVEE